MIEIVFGDSACGSLKMAQHYGQGAYPGGCVGVIISRSDGKAPSNKEKRAAQREAEKKERLAWESGTPMGGNPSDVYGFGLMLSVGDISEDVPSIRRRQALERLYSVYPSNTGRNVAQEVLRRANADLKALRERMAAGETVRIWYSDQPDECCGFYWLMAQLDQWKECWGQIYTVKLPEVETDREGNFIRMLSWSEVDPGEWHRYLALQELASPTFCQRCATDWRILQGENAPLRAMLNGRLVSMQATLYDGFIRREIAAESETFHEARLIGKLLGKHGLGVGDAWIALRIEEMIHSGELETVTESADDMPIYHRVLRKRSKW